VSHPLHCTVFTTLCKDRLPRPMVCRCVPRLLQGSPSLSSLAGVTEEDLPTSLSTLLIVSNVSLVLRQPVPPLFVKLDNGNASRSTAGEILLKITGPMQPWHPKPSIRLPKPPVSPDKGHRTYPVPVPATRLTRQRHHTYPGLLPAIQQRGSKGQGSLPCSPFSAEVDHNCFCYLKGF
jgi:hypothetical protein